MEEMSYQELFEVGVSFESAVGEGTKGERARIPKNNSRIILTDDIVEKITSIDRKINVLVSGEIWCPDFQINVAILKRFIDLNPNLEISIITMGRGRKYISRLIGIEKEDFKAPTIIFLDEEFNFLGKFQERPKKVLKLDFEEIKRDYYKGMYINDSINDFLEILLNKSVD